MMALDSRPAPVTSGSAPVGRAGDPDAAPEAR